MTNTSTILLSKDTIALLKKVKENSRETYNEIIKKMARLFLILKQRNQYDEFLHKIQQPKMMELWDNKEDEIWDKV